MIFNESVEFNLQKMFDDIVAGFGNTIVLFGGRVQAFAKNFLAQMVMRHN